MKARQATKIIMKLAKPIRRNGQTFYTRSPATLIGFLDNCKNPKICKARKVFGRKFKKKY